MWKKIVCWFIGHDTPPGSRTSLFSFVCFRCDTVVYVGPVKEQGEKWGRQKYKARSDKPKFAVAA